MTTELRPFTAFERFRLLLGGELIELGSRIVPMVGEGDPGCDNPPEWIIYDNEPYKFTYSCTLHLSDMVSVDTEVINRYEAVDVHAKQKTCCYLYSTEAEDA